MIPRRFRPCSRPAGGSAALLAVLLGAGPLAAAPGPTPTPTPRPRLSGGFGRTPARPATGDGQSMADVVKAAGASREKKEGKGGVAITNENLVKDTTKGHVSTSQVRNPTPSPARSTPGAPAPAVGTAAAPAPTALPLATTEQEAVWRDRAHRARQRVEELKAQIATLETDAKQLENDFYRWDDGQYRDRVIKPAWDKKREELETAKRQLAAAEAELADLPEQARKAGALPGWLRE